MEILIPNREQTLILENSSLYKQHVVLPLTTSLLHYWDEFVKHFEFEGKSPVTIGKVRDSLEFLVRNCGVLTVEQCNTPKILREALFEQKQKRNWSNTTFNTYVKNINTYFIWLEDMEYIKKNKIKMIRKHKAEQNEQITLSSEQVKLLIGHLRARETHTRLERLRNELFFGIAIVSGARPCELTNMKVADVRESINGNCEICIRGRKQKGKPRYYNLPSWLIEIYSMYMDVRSKLERNESKLFISASKRTGWTYQGARKLCIKLTKELGFKVTCYAIRRFVATELFKKGLEMPHIMNHMGHTRPSTTMGYVRNSGALTSDGVDMLGRIIK